MTMEFYRPARRVLRCVSLIGGRMHSDTGEPFFEATSDRTVEREGSFVVPFHAE